MSKQKILAVLVAFGALAALSPAPFVHKGSGSVPPTTQAQLSKEQSLARTQAPVGNVETEAQNRSKSSERLDPDAATALQSAQSSLDGTSKSATVAVLKNAEQKVRESHRSPWLNLFWMLVAGGLGYAAVFAFRKWADKAIPTNA